MIEEKASGPICETNQINIKKQISNQTQNILEKADSCISLIFRFTIQGDLQNQIQTIKADLDNLKQNKDVWAIKMEKKQENEGFSNMERSSLDSESAVNEIPSFQYLATKPSCELC